MVQESLKGKDKREEKQINLMFKKNSESLDFSPILSDQFSEQLFSNV